MEEVVVGRKPESAEVVESTKMTPVARFHYEQNLGQEISVMYDEVKEVKVTNDAEYKKAGEFLKQIKAMSKRITDYWEPIRLSTKRAYDDVLEKKKEMLSPVDKAEKWLKGEMGRYTIEQQRLEAERRRKEEELRRRLIQEELDRKLAEAAQAEAYGNTEEAETAMAEAEVIDQMTLVQPAVTPVEKPKADGVSVQKTWRIKSIDDSKVPISVAGVVIRPVDNSAILRLVKASKGKIEIPGVEIEEDSIVSVRT